MYGKTPSYIEDEWSLHDLRLHSISFMELESDTTPEEQLTEIYKELGW